MADSKQTSALPVEDAKAIVAGTVQSVVQELRKPDPQVEAQKARHRERIRAEREIAEGLRKEREAMCPHRRENNTSTIAWMSTPGPDNISTYTRGVCQRCQRLIQPTDTDFRELLAIPTGVPQF